MQGVVSPLDANRVPSYFSSLAGDTADHANVTKLGPQAHAWFCTSSFLQQQAFIINTSAYLSSFVEMSY